MIEEKFNYKGVSFELIKRGSKALIFKAKASFYDCESLEVWKIRNRLNVKIGDVLIGDLELKPNNENYYYTAHQYMRNHYKTDEAFHKSANDRFAKYEQGVEVDVNRI